VYCWGSGDEGDLGNGTFDGSAAPVAVEGIGGTGTLGGVVSLSSDDYYSGYCAVLTSGGVDCWGYGLYGQLGNGMFYTPGNDGCQTCGSAEPVAVEGIGGTGTLGGVVKLSSDGLGYCALLASGAVDCWGAGTQGQLGNATFYTPSNNDGSAVPVAVDAVGGSETLSGVVGLYSDNEYSTSGGGGYCALLTSGAVDCWGAGSSGELGDGTYYTPSNNDGSAVPVAVEGVGGSGTLGGVASLSSDNVGGYCALLTSGGVNCWGYGYDGQLGNGTFYTTSDDGSAVPVAVEGVGGSGTLGGVASLSSSELGYCAQLGSGGVDCWGSGDEGDLGNGNFYSTGTDFPGGSAVPVAVAGTDGSGTLGGVTSLSMGGLGYCALVNSGGVDCWGYGYYGNLGNGTFYDNWPDEGSAVPVAVEGEDGSGTLGGIASLSSDSVGALGGGYCGLLTSGGVDCWGNGADGQLGNGIDYTASNNDGSAVPVAVEGIGPLLLAFGDSVAAGEGNQVPSGVTGLSCTSTSPSPYCGDDNGMWTDSPDAYPAVLASELGMSVDNFAISGACAGPDDQANDLPNCSTSAAPKPTVLDNEIPLAKSMGLNLDTPMNNWSR
jgi:alpha-tubulin suppressor-like RCC1 family protein